MILVGNANASIGIDAGWQILAAGATVLRTEELPGSELRQRTGAG